jgi:hypothetical protein
MENKYYENGDSIVLLIKVLQSNEGKLFICLNYSCNHRMYNLDVLPESEFMKYFAGNEIDYEFDDLGFNGLLKS